jgi:hypothetical protein
LSSTSGANEEDVEAVEEDVVVTPVPVEAVAEPVTEFEPADEVCGVVRTLEVEEPLGGEVGGGTTGGITVDAASTRIFGEQRRIPRSTNRVQRGAIAIERYLQEI